MEELHETNQIHEFGERFPHLKDIETVCETVEGDGDRAKLMELIDTLGPGSNIYTIAIDRLSRSLKDLLHIVEICEGRGISLISVRQGGDILKFDRAALIIFGLVAEMEKKNISERTKAGIARARKESANDPKRLGLWGAPLIMHQARLKGKPISRIGGKRVNKKYLKAIPYMRELRASGMTLKRIAELATQQYKVEFSKFNVCRLLKYGHG